MGATLVVVPSLVAEHGLQGTRTSVVVAGGLSSWQLMDSRAQAQLWHGGLVVL